MIRDVLNRLSRAEEHYRESTPNLAALLRDAITVIERDRFLEVLKAEVLLLKRESSWLDSFNEMCSSELESTEKLIAELESFYANRDNEPNDAGIPPSAPQADNAE